MTAIHVVSAKAKWTPWIITMNSHIIVSNKITQMRNLSSPLVLTVTIDIHLLNSVNIRSVYYWAFPLPHRVLHLFLTVFQCNLKKYYSNQNRTAQLLTKIIKKYEVEWPVGQPADVFTVQCNKAYWRKFHHLLHWNFPKWHTTSEKLVTKISLKWQDIHFNVSSIYETAPEQAKHNHAHTKR